jgi:hypothetical protein
MLVGNITTGMIPLQTRMQDKAEVCRRPHMAESKKYMSALQQQVTITGHVKQDPTWVGSFCDILLPSSNKSIGCESQYKVVKVVT